MYCPKCGADNAEGAAYCTSCGASLAVAPATVQPPSTAAAAQPTKSPILAAILNFLFGLGYVYLGYHRVMGLQAVGFVMVMVLAYFLLGIFTLGIVSLVIAILLAVDGYQKALGQKGFVTAR
jgi:hypothetical protein